MCIPCVYVGGWGEGVVNRNKRFAKSTKYANFVSNINLKYMQDKSNSKSTNKFANSNKTQDTRWYTANPYLYLACNIHYWKKFKEHFDIMIFIERYHLKRCQGCVKLIASKVNCFLNINDLSEVQLCMSSNSWTWECPHTKDGADHVPLIFLSSVFGMQYIYDANKQGLALQTKLLEISRFGLLLRFGFFSFSLCMNVTYDLYIFHYAWMWHVTCDLWPVTCDLWPVTCDLWPVTCDLWPVTMWPLHILLCMNVTFTYPIMHDVTCDLYIFSLCMNVTCHLNIFQVVCLLKKKVQFCDSYGYYGNSNL